MTDEPTRRITIEGVLGYLGIIGFAVLVVLVLAFMAGFMLILSIPSNVD